MSTFDRKDFANRLFIAMVNPWKENTYELDEPALRKLVNYYLEQGARDKIGLIVNPEAGEIFYLTRREKARIVEIVLDEVKGRVPVVAGVLDVSSEGTLAVARDVKRLGVDGVFVMPPIGAIDITTSWNPVAYPEVWLDEIKAIDAICDLPILAHPVGAATMAYGIGIPEETTMAICEAVPNMVGWKMTYNWEGWKRVGRALKKREPSVAILGACAALFHEAQACNFFDGTVTGSFNYAMEPMLDHIRAFQDGDQKQALAIWEGGLGDLQEWMYADLSRIHIRYKVATWLRGLVPHPYMRPPFPAPRQEEISALVQLMTAAGLKIIDAAQISGLRARPAVKNIDA